MGLVRLFLALVVAADHWRVIALAPVSPFMDDRLKLGFNAGNAVMFFYVISGFLITFTLTRNYSRDFGGVRDFYRNHFIRILSLYWPLVLLSFLLVDGVWQQFVSADFLDQFMGFLLVGVDWNLAFANYPALNWNAPIASLHQAWTLGAELTFYLATPLLLRLWKAAFVLLLASFELRAAIVSMMGLACMRSPYHFAGATFGFFLLGH